MQITGRAVLLQMLEDSRVDPELAGNDKRRKVLLRRKEALP